MLRDGAPRERPPPVSQAIFVAACVAVPPLTSVTLPLAYAFLRHKRFVGRSMTELKRLEALTKSPAVSRFADTIAGLAELRAFGREAHARRRLLAACDANARAWYGWLLSQRYLGFWLDFMCVAFLACLVALAALLRNRYPQRTVWKSTTGLGRPDQTLKFNYAHIQVGLKI